MSLSILEWMVDTNLYDTCPCSAWKRIVSLLIVLLQTRGYVFRRLTTHVLVVVFDGEVGQRCCDHAALLSVGRQNVLRMSRPAVTLKVKIHVLIIYPPVDLSWAMANAMKDWEKDNAGLDTMNLDR